MSELIIINEETMSDLSRSSMDDTYPHVSKEIRKYQKECKKAGKLNGLQFIPVDSWALICSGTRLNNVDKYDKDFKYIVNLTDVKQLNDIINVAGKLDINTVRVCKDMDSDIRSAIHNSLKNKTVRIVPYSFR